MSQARKKLGVELKSLREIRGLRQNAVAKLANCDPSYLASIELGRRARPSTPVLERLVEALRLSQEEAARVFYLATLDRYAGERVGALSADDIPEAGPLIAALPDLSRAELQAVVLIVDNLARARRASRTLEEKPM